MVKHGKGLESLKSVPTSKSTTYIDWVFLVPFKIGFYGQTGKIIIPTHISCQLIGKKMILEGIDISRLILVYQMISNQRYFDISLKKVKY